MAIPQCARRPDWMRIAIGTALIQIVLLGFTLTYYLPAHGDALAVNRIRSSARTRDRLRARSSALPVSDLRSRICGPGDLSQPWYDECCTGPAARALDAMPPLAAHLLPSFSCPDAQGSGVLVSCAWVRDGLCDCSADGRDEPESGACPAGYLFCASGPKRASGGSLVPITQRVEEVPAPNYRAAADAVRTGQIHALWGLGFIPSALVRDGVEDCARGEDERAVGSTAVTVLPPGPGPSLQ